MSGGLGGEPHGRRHRQDAGGRDGGALARRRRAPGGDREPGLRPPPGGARRARVGRRRAAAAGRAGRRRAAPPGPAAPRRGRRRRRRSPRGGPVDGDASPPGRGAARRRIPAAATPEGRGDRVPGCACPLGARRALPAGHAPRAAVRSRAGAPPHRDPGRRPAEPRRSPRGDPPLRGAGACLAADYAVEGLEDLGIGRASSRDGARGPRRPRLRGDRRAGAARGHSRRPGRDRAGRRGVSGSPRVRAARPRRRGPAGPGGGREPPGDDGEGRGAPGIAGLAGDPGPRQHRARREALLPMWVLRVRLEPVAGAAQAEVVRRSEAFRAWRAELRARVDAATRESRARRRDREGAARSPGARSRASWCASRTGWATRSWRLPTLRALRGALPGAELWCLGPWVGSHPRDRARHRAAPRRARGAWAPGSPRPAASGRRASTSL